jgi:hypothetical protein
MAGDVADRAPIIKGRATAKEGVGTDTAREQRPPGGA